MQFLQINLLQPVFHLPDRFFQPGKGIIFGIPVDVHMRPATRIFNRNINNPGVPDGYRDSIGTARFVVIYENLTSGMVIVTVDYLQPYHFFDDHGDQQGAVWAKARMF